MESHLKKGEQRMEIRGDNNISLQNQSGDNSKVENQIWDRNIIKVKGGVNVGNISGDKVNINLDSSGKGKKIPLTIGEPFEPIEEIIGREEEQREIIERLKDGKRKGVVIYGEGGIGKTTLARSVYSRIKGDFGAKIVLILTEIESGETSNLRSRLIEAFTRGSITDPDFQRLQKRIENFKKEGEKFEAILNYLNGELGGEEKLIVIDNVVKVGRGNQLDLNNFKKLLSVSNSKFLITSRERIEDLNLSNFPLSYLSLQKGIELFEFQLGEEREKIEEKREIVKGIVEEVGGVPFFISLFARTLRRKRELTPEKLLEELKSLQVGNIRFRDQQEGKTSIGEFYTRRLEVGWRYLEEEERKILKKVALLPANYPIEESLLEEYLKRETKEIWFRLLKFSNELIRFIRNGCKRNNKLSTSEMVKGLKEGGWLKKEITPKKGKKVVTYQLHPITKEYLLRVKGVKFEEIKPQIEWALEKMKDSSNSGKAAKLNQEGYLPILEEIGESLKLLFQKPLIGEWKIEKKQIAQIGTVFLRIGILFLHLGEYSKAEKHLIKAKGVFKQYFGEEHPDTAISYNNLGGVYEVQGDYTKAKNYYQKALKIRENLLGEEHPDTAISYNNLGSLYHEQGDYTQAEEYYQKALKITENLLGEEHPNTATSYNNLGGLYYTQRDYTKAKKYLQKAYQIFQNKLGQNHPYTQKAKTKLEEVKKKLQEKKK